ncbi:MAG TPA: DUF1444 family protein [Phycisphaerales bacterium]|nr:DUF1444 family protein [Phycisphaerales bacterium]HRQ74323.1 DUF1444 family protein [Phycisphaerales bacterium]
MSQMPREPEAFGEQVAQILKRFLPQREIELAGPMDLVLNGKHLGLENLYRMVQCDPDRGVEIVENYLERLLETDSVGATPLPLSIAKPRIMPRIQPEAIFEHLDREQVAHIPFVNGTVVVFVIDMPHSTVSITVEQVLKWGLQPDDLDEIARENLARYTPELDIQIIDSTEGGRAAIVSAQDGYDAARLLLGSLHHRLAPELHGDFYVATPARDMFLAITCNPAEFVERIYKRVQLDYRRLPYPITSKLFVVTRDGVAGTSAEAA